MALPDLLAQLEESKFLHLFRQLAPIPDPEGHFGERFSGISVPLDLEDAELHLRPLEQESWGAGRNLLTANWFSHLAYCPVALRDQGAIESFIDGQLRRAFMNIRDDPDAVEAMNRRPGYRLLERLGVAEEKVAKWDGDALSVEYHVFTNLLYERSWDQFSRFCENATKLFVEVLGEKCAEAPEFDFASAHSLQRSAEEVEKALVELLNMPSNFYLVAREGHISVIPTTEHGAFLASGSGELDDRRHGLSAVISSSLSPERVPSLTALKDFEALLNDRMANERDLQAFFEQNPQFLFALDERYCEVRAHVSLLDGRDNRLIPDFMARVQDSNVWEVIELKQPRDCVQSHRDGKSKVSAAVARAVSETLRYREVFSTRDNRRRMTQQFGIAAYEPCMTVVIGRGRSRERLEWKSARPLLPSVEIVSYDYLFERARSCRAELDEALKHKS
jgi:hypothetical protein